MDPDLAALVQRVDALAARNDRLEARSDRLEVENAELRDDLADLRPTRAEPTARGAKAGPDRPPLEGGRRWALRTGLAATAAAVVAGATIGDLSPAAAADGSALVLGSSSQGCTSGTGFAVNGTNVGYGLLIADHSGLTSPTDNPGLETYADGQAFDTGIKTVVRGQAKRAILVDADGKINGIDVETYEGTAGTFRAGNGLALYAATISNFTYGAQVFNDGTGRGMYVRGGEIGLEVVSSTALALSASSQATTGGGVEVDATGFHLRFSNTTSRPSPTGDGFAHLAGDVVEDSASSLWLCVASGTPGSWRKLGGPQTAGQFHLLGAPVRVYDSRAGTAPAGGSKTPLPANTARAVDLKNASSGVPPGAIGAVVTVLLLNATAGNGNFTIWANGQVRPSGNTMVWGGNAGRFCTTAITRLDGAAQCQVFSSLKTDLTVDVVGYYR